MPFWRRYDFSKTYLLCIMKFGHLISWSILKIFLSINQPWIYFSCDIDTFKDVWFFVMILCDHLFLFFKFIYVCHVFLSNLDFVVPLGVFVVICPLNECLTFGMLIKMCRNCLLKFFVIKLQSKPFFHKLFYDASFSNCMLMILYFTWNCYYF